MIKVEVNKGYVDIKELSGTGINIMSELCCLVKAVCQGYCEDEDNSKEKCSHMVLAVADALEFAEKTGFVGKKIEDDENADF